MGIKFFAKKSKSYLGIDIGSFSVKLVELAKEQNELKLLTYGEYKIPGQEEEEKRAFYSTSLDLPEGELAGILKDLWKESQARSTLVSMSIPVFSTFFTVMELPPMPKEEISQAIQFQARQYVPIPISEVILDWSVVEKPFAAGESPKLRVILVAVPKEIAYKYVRLAKLCGFELRAVEVETFSLARSLIKKDDPGVTLVVDMGSRNTNVCIVDRGLILASHNFDISGRNLTQAISHSLNIEWLRAENLKKEMGLQVSGESRASVGQIITPLVDNILNEIDRVMHIYTRRYGRKVEKIILAGGGTIFPGLKEYFVERFGKETQAANPFLNIAYPQILDRAIREIAPTFCVAVGLAKRELT